MATRWGIAGAGKISHDFASAMKSLPATEHTLIAVAARDLSRAKQFADLHKIQHSYDKYEELAKNPDIEVVYIGVLNPQHFEVARLMLSHGKHVLCEKPLTMNTKETVNLINFAKEKKLFLMEAVWSRCFPIYEVVKKQIDSDQIGKVHQVVASFGFNMPHIERLNSKQMGGGTVLDLGIYVLQFACLIFNNEMPEKVHATGFLNEDGVDISTSITLLYSGNRTATLLTHSLVDLPNEACVLGTKGMLKIPTFWAPNEAYLCGNKIECPLPKTTGTFNFVNSVGLSYEAAEVRNCLQKGLLESPKVPHDLSIQLANLEDEIRRQIGVKYPQD